MGRRKKIRDRTKLCSALLALGTIPYDDAKLMTEAQFLSLWQFDHNILHEAQHPDGDKFWNLTPMLIKAHRTKTKADAKIIAKSRRIRAWNEPRPDLMDLDAEGILGVVTKDGHLWVRDKRRLRSRGFDRRYIRKMDGTVVKRGG